MLAAMSEPYSRIEGAGPIATVRMIDPRRKNAMSTAMLTSLVTDLRTVASKASISAVVVTGSDGVFSSGADVSEKVDHAQAVARMRLFCNLYELATRFPKPLIAAVSGPAIGGGAEVAAACDLRVGDPSARFRFPGGAFDIPIGSARLPLLIGLSHAKDLLLTTRMVEAQEAFRMGLLNRLVEPEDLEDVAVELAAQIASNPGATGQKRRLDHFSQLSSRVYAEDRELMRWQASATQPPTAPNA